MTEEIAALEKEIFELREKLRKARASAAPERVSDYQFTRSDGSSVTLSELFGPSDDLIVVHNMGRSCVYCTMWADGLNGVVDHLANRGSFVVASPDEPSVQTEFAVSRNWEFPMVSSAGNTFFDDMGFEKDGKPWPGVSAFHRQDDGSIVRTGKAHFGPGDEFCSVWHLFDLLDGGPGEWQPKYSY
jgi:predicted dithiol-disulfide oxidoreductase (DUF899 family)